jgi:hypothetical protein
MAGRRSPQSPSISQLTSPLDPIPSCYRRSRHTEFQPRSRRYLKSGDGGYLPDFGIAPWGGWNLVSQGFVDIVERLEPGVHEFLPIAETVDHAGQAINKRFFLMNILQKFNAVWVERSSVSFREHHVAEAELNFTVRTMMLVPPEILVLKKALVEGHHLWHGTTGDMYQVFFSELLHDAVLAAGLSPLDYFRAEEA